MLVNNAGVAGRRGLTKQGFELMFGVNHLGHFLLTELLLERLTSSGPARVVTVASDAHYSARGIDWDALRRPARGITGLGEYAVSKLCNVLFSQELARRTEGTGVHAYALHPGVVASDIWRRVPWPVRPLVTRRMLTVDQGAQTSLYCATSPSVAATAGGSTTSARCGRPARWPRPSWAGHYGSGARPGPPFKLGQWIFPSTRRWRRCWPSRWMPSRMGTTSSSRSGTASGRSCSATATRLRSAAGTNGR